MKARVKTTGEIKEVTRGIYSPYQYVDKEGTIYTEDQLEELSEGGGVIFYDPTIDYWTRLEHQYAGMAMQGILSNANHALWDRENNAEGIAKGASAIAHALVQKLKNE